MATYRVPVLKDFSWQPPVADKDLTDPPGGEAKGDRYIVASAGAGGAWTGLENHIVTYDGAAWLDDTPSEGWTVWVLDEDCYYHYTGAGAWDKDDVDAMASSIDSIETIASDALAAAASVETRMLSVTSDMTASINTMVDSAISDVNAVIDSAISDLKASAHSELLSQAKILSDAVDTMVDSAISDVVATIDTDTASLATAISTVDDRVDSVEVRMLSVTSDMTTSINTQIDSAISDLKASAHSELLSQVVILSDATSNVKASAAAAQPLSDATSAVKESLLSDLASAISNIGSIADVATASLATAIASVETIASDALAAAASVETRMLSVTSDMTASINTMVDSAISDLTAATQTVGSYIAAYGAIEFTI